MSNPIQIVRYNPDYETFEALHADGYITPLRDSVEADDVAAQYGLTVEDEAVYRANDTHWQ